MKDKEKVEIVSLLDGVFKGIKEGHQSEAQEFLSNEDNGRLFDKVFGEEGHHVENYHHLVSAPHQRVIRSILIEKGVKSYQGRFILDQFNFIKSHIENLLVEKDEEEGCAEASRKLIRMYYNHYEYALPLIVEALPEKVLNTEGEALRYFEAIYSLYHGSPKKYIAIRG